MTLNQLYDICHVFATFMPTTSGGVEHYIINVSKFVHSLGYTSSLITPKYRCEARSQTAFDDLGFLKVSRIGVFPPPYVRISKRFIGPFLNMSLYKWNAILGARLSKEIIDVGLFHVHSGFFSLELGYRLSKQFGRPIVLTIHERLDRSSPIFSHRVSAHDRMILDSARAIIVHRHFSASVLEKLGLGGKTMFLPMFINVREYERPYKDVPQTGSIIRFLFAGRLEERRDPLLLLRAFSKVYKQHTNIELHIIGDGSLKGKFEALVRRYGLTKSVFLYGEQASIKKYLWNSHIFISTNKIDDYPSLALREAMATGLAIIDTDAGETKRLIDNGENGVLVQPSDSNALSDVMSTLIEDEKFRNRLGYNANISSREFDAGKVLHPLLKLYGEIVGR